MMRRLYSEKGPSSMLGLFFLMIIMVSMFLRINGSAAERTYEDLWDDDKNAYIIASSADFILFRSAITNQNSFENKVILLKNDITMDQDLPAIKSMVEFRGYFNGQGHTIDGITAKGKVCVFPEISGVLTNTKFTDMDVEGGFIDSVGDVINPRGEVAFCSFQGKYHAPYNGIDTIKNNYANINNCVIDMDLSSTLEAPVAFNGIADNSDKGEITNCVFIGNINAAEAQKGKSISAIANKGQVKNCYYAEKDYYTEDSLGTACSEEALKKKTTYDGFDFENIWKIRNGENDGYPYLRSDIDDAYLPVLPDEVALPLTYKLSVRDVTYNQEEGTFDTYFPITMSGPEYTGDDPLIRQDLEEILKKCEAQAEVLTPAKMIEGDRNALCVIPRDGYSINLERSSAERYVKHSEKPSKETGYKVMVSVEWENAQATFHAEIVPTELTKEQKDAYIAKAHETMKTIIDRYVSEYPKQWIGDPWFAVACGRCEYYPEGITEDMIYDSIVEARWKEYEGTKQDELPKNFDMNAISKDILAITAIGYDARNVCGIDLVEILNNRSLTNDNYFAGQYKAYALYSGDYGGDYAQMGKDLTENFQFDELKDSYDTDDMKTMQAQPIFLCKDEAGENIQKVEQWLSQSQTMIGSFPGYNGFGNVWTNAQAHILMGICGIDFLSPDFVKNGTTVLDIITNSPELSLGYAGERTQCAKGLAALTRSYEGKTDLFDCSDVKGALYVSRLIEKLPDKVTLEDEQAISDAKTAYDALSGGKQAVVTGYQKLEDAEAVIWNEEKANEFCKKVDEQLPESADELTLQDSAAVKKLLEELQNMADEVKPYVPDACRAKLESYAQRIADLEEAQKVIDKINKIGEVTLDSAAAIQEARSAYEALSEVQKEIVKENGAFALLEAAEAALQDKTVDALIEDINKFQKTEEIVLEDEKELINLRDRYNALTKSLQAKVTNLDVLESAEAAMKELKTKYVLSLIRELRSKEELQTVNDDRSVTDHITTGDITAIAQAQAALDDLKGKYKGIEEEIKAMEGGANLLTKLAEDNDIAREYEGYVEEYLQPMIDELLGTDVLSVDNTTIASVEANLKKYEDYLKTDGDYLASVKGLTEYAEALKERAERVRKAVDAAKAVDQLIETLPTEEIKTDKKLEEVQDLLKEVSGAYEDLDELAKGYVQNLALWEQVQANAEAYADKKSQAEDVIGKIKDALADAEENLTDDSTVAALKAAGEAYDKLSKDIQPMVTNSSEIEKLEKKIAAAKQERLAKNGILTIKETIPYDVSVSIVSAASKLSDKLEQQLKSDKKAELVQAFTLKSYRIMADGSKTDGGQELTGVMTCEDSFANKNIYLLQIADADQGTAYVKTAVSGNAVTFTLDADGAYALGLSKASADDGKDDDVTPSPTPSKSNGGGSQSGNNTTIGGGSQSGNSNTTGGTSVPKTGDSIPRETAASAAMVLAASGLLAVLLRKKKAAERC